MGIKVNPDRLIPRKSSIPASEPCNLELPEEFKPKCKPPEIDEFRNKWIYEVLSDEKMIEMLNETEKLEEDFKGDSDLKKEVRMIACEIYNKYKIWRCKNVW